MTSRPLVLAAALCFLPLLSCKDTTDAGAEGGGSESSADDDDGSGSAESGPSGTDSASGSGSGDTTGNPMPVDVPARAVQISSIEANPGVAIPIVVDGQWVDGPERRAQIPRFRNTAFRAYLDVDDAAWIPRNIEGRLTVIQADASEKEYVEVVEIAADSSTTSLQSNILFGVLAEDMQPGAKFQVELYEAGPGYESLPEEQTPPSALPEPDFIGIEGSYQNMRVMIVPIDYSFGDCTTMFDISEESLAKYEDAMFQQNGVETIEFQVHDYYAVNDLDLGTESGFFPLLNRIVQLRASEAPDPNVYYYGLFDNCGQCIGGGGGCTLGVAPGQPDGSMGAAGSRAAIGTQFLGNDEVGIETFVHEIGHTQGRAHVACPGGNAQGTDPSYPHAEGRIGVWGFGVRDFQIRSATLYSDYMSYCNPTWVSDWQWKETFERIRTLSSWEMADMVEFNRRGSSVLAGAYNTETGESTWWTDRGEVTSADDELSFGIDFLQGSTNLGSAEVVDVDAWSEGPWVTVRTPLPEAFDTNVDAIQVHAPAASQRVRVLDIPRYHAADGLRTP